MSNVSAVHSVAVAGCGNAARHETRTGPGTTMPGVAVRTKLRGKL